VVQAVLDGLVQAHGLDVGFVCCLRAARD
jgi:hypothetical protein